VRAAHSLKGMSGVIRSPQLVQHALELEMTARDGDLDAVRVRFPVFEELIGQALESIRGYLDDTG
jgi:HPt (histidine-containing phosphotransfer) domain-containing protein